MAVRSGGELGRRAPSAPEHARLLEQGRGPQSPYPREATVQSLFEACVSATPRATALVFEGLELSYAELNRHANRLAHRLRALGVGPDVAVAIGIERSVELIVAILATLKAGGAYVPLDPDYPRARLEFMLQDTAAPVLITRSRTRSALPAGSAAVVELDDFSRACLECPETNPSAVCGPHDLAYVMYTSGSTGTPKGVCIEQRSVVKLVRNASYIEVRPDDVFLQLAPVSFDASTLELWGALLNGARLVVFAPGRISLERVAETVKCHRVSVLWLTSAVFHQMVDRWLEALTPVRVLLTGGDVVSPSHARRYLSTVERGRCLVNGYGPTEGTTFTCCHVMHGSSRIGRSVPIGRPVSNSSVYILDERLEPVPVGEPGELHIGGDGLARGYLHADELTRQKFIRNPFDASGASRLYRSGDRCRWLADGTIEFIGRLDTQVKLRGHRIELAEIEWLLGAQPGVREAVVLCREDVPGDKRLVAYLTASEGGRPAAEALRAKLREQLPDPMIPSAFVVLDAMPVTANGKVDRGALPPPPEPQLPAGAVIASGAVLEQRLAGIWTQLLHIDELGPHDNFFERGGHSLLVLELQHRIKVELGVEIPLAAFFERPTVDGQLGLVREALASTR